LVSVILSREQIEQGIRMCWGCGCDDCVNNALPAYRTALTLYDDIERLRGMVRNLGIMAEDANPNLAASVLSLCSAEGIRFTEEEFCEANEGAA
jgi:hypothetical protein